MEESNNYDSDYYNQLSEDIYNNILNNLNKNMHDFTHSLHFYFFKGIANFIKRNTKPNKLQKESLKIKY